MPNSVGLVKVDKGVYINPEQVVSIRESRNGLSSINTTNGNITAGFVEKYNNFSETNIYERISADEVARGIETARTSGKNVDLTA